MLPVRRFAPNDSALMPPLISPAASHVMTTWQMVLIGLYAVILALVLWRHWVCHWTLRTTPSIVPLPPRPWEQDDYWPMVSIMVPAKDEAEGIEACVRSLLEQDYPHFEVIVIDDRSTDGTAEIVERLARDNGRVRLVSVTELPAGWTGKTHALHVGRQHARGGWFLFVDADTRHHVSCVTSVMRHALQTRSDMVSLLPAMQCRSFWEHVIQPFAGTCLMILYPLPKANNPQCVDSGFANGQFILVSRAAFAEIGGHQAVRDKFVEDIHLGRNIRRAGLRLRVAFGADVSSVRMYSSLEGILRGWTRIFYSGADCRPQRLYQMAAFITLMSVMPYAVIAGTLVAKLAGADSSFVNWLLGMGLIHEGLQLALYARTYAVSHAPLRWLAFRWLAVFSMLAILKRTIALCKTHELTWRGTAYGREMQPAAMPNAPADRPAVQPRESQASQREAC